MDMLSEYNQLMESAGHGKVATAQMVRYNITAPNNSTPPMNDKLLKVKCHCGALCSATNIARHRKSEKCKRKMESLSAKAHVLVSPVHDHLVASLQEEEQESQPLLPQLSGQHPS